ncbi:MAG: hypothetical protein AAF195_04275, partial [Pseudomonadota bacterium]
KDFIDPALELTRQDFIDNLSKPQNNLETKSDNIDFVDSTDELSFLLEDKKESHFTDDILVTLSAYESTPIKDILMEVSVLSGIDIEIDPSIDANIILRVTDKPLREVINRIARLANVRYSMRNGVLMVENDTPYIENYSVNILNLIRSSEGEISVNTSVLSSSVGSGGEGGGGDSLSSGSSNSISLESDGDIWTSIEAGLNNIINSSSNEEENSTISRNISVNRQAGLISIMGTSVQHADARDYLNKIIKQASSQVLIEAKILEIALDDQYAAGINWNGIFRSQGITVTGDFSTGTTEALTIDINDIFGSDLASAISLTEQFGTSKTLSNPRIIAANNQQAVLTFAENEVYFTLDLEEEEEEGTDNNGDVTTITYESEINTVPIGIILSLQPSIDIKNSEILINIRPTLSRITDFIADPAVDLFAALNNIEDVVSEVPVIEVREIDSVLKIKSGGVMVIGGLMEERSINDDKGAPFLAKIPAVGNLFKSVSKQQTVIETVIFVKATIIENNDNVHLYDKHLYNTFAPNDNRRLYPRF